MKTSAVPMTATNTARISSSLRRSIRALPFAGTPAARRCRADSWGGPEGAAEVRHRSETRETDVMGVLRRRGAEWQRKTPAPSVMQGGSGPGRLPEGRSAAKGGELVLALADHDVALELEARRQLATPLGPVVREDHEPPDRLCPRHRGVRV